MRLKRLSTEAFDNAAANTRMGGQAIQMARAVLVDGCTQVEVAAKFGLTKQRVSLAVATIERAYSKFAVSPGEGSIRAEFELPEALAFELDAFIAAMGSCENVGKAKLALESLAESMRKATAMLGQSDG